MWPNRVSNSVTLALQSDALPREKLKTHKQISLACRFTSRIYGYFSFIFSFLLMNLQSGLKKWPQRYLYPALAKLFLLLFADDIALLSDNCSDTVIGLQRQFYL